MDNICREAALISLKENIDAEYVRVILTFLLVCEWPRCIIFVLMATVLQITYTHLEMAHNSCKPSLSGYREVHPYN